MWENFSSYNNYCNADQQYGIQISSDHFSLNSLNCQQNLNLHEPVIFHSSSKSSHEWIHKEWYIPSYIVKIDQILLTQFIVIIHSTFLHRNVHIIFLPCFDCRKISQILIFHYKKCVVCYRKQKLNWKTVCNFNWGRGT